MRNFWETHRITVWLGWSTARRWLAGERDSLNRAPNVALPSSIPLTPGPEHHQHRSCQLHQPRASEHTAVEHAER